MRFSASSSSARDTGSPAEIRKTAIAYRTFFARSGATGPGNYAVDHTGFVYLLGKDGRYLGFLPPGLAPDAIADSMRARLGAEYRHIIFCQFGGGDAQEQAAGTERAGTSGRQWTS